MANKFTKSVLERLEQEAVRKKNMPINEKKETTNDEKPLDKNIQSKVLETKKEEAPKKTKSQQIKSKKTKSEIGEPKYTTIPDISAFLPPESQRLAKNKTFYLDIAVIDSIRTVAKERNITESKLVNNILRAVLKTNE